MEKSFPEFYDYYLSVIGDNSHLNGQNMQVGTLNVICKYILDSPNCNNVVFELMLKGKSQLAITIGWLNHFTMHSFAV